VTGAFPVTPSLVAEMWAVPVATAATKPVVAFTVAAAGLSEAHVTVRPLSVRF
jgi:hypothetical protein